MAGQSDDSVGSNGLFYQDRLIDHSSPGSPPTRPQIRPLFIDPAPFGVLVQGRLETFDLEDAPSYKALSYSWGDAAASSIITLGENSRFLVRRNLEDALQRIRHASETICIWIDGICINQADSAERSSQVSLMGQVFTNAAEVLVWLGETRIVPHVEQAMYGTAIGLAQQRERIWWRRLWVVQETASAQRLPTILFGPAQMQWEQFLLQWRDLCDDRRRLSAGQTRTHNIEPQFLEDGHSALEMMGQLWKTDPTHRKLHRMLVQTRNYVCLDDHDRIYALLHLMGPSERELFSPDYNSPAENVFATATIDFLQSSSLGFDALLCYWYRGSQKQQDSWWFDFEHSMPSAQIPFYCTSRDLAINTDPVLELQIIEDNRLLHATGVPLESVDFIRPFRTFFEGIGKVRSFDLDSWIGFFKDVRYREKRGKMAFFAAKASRISVERYRKVESDLPPEVLDLRLDLTKSLVWIFRTYGTSLSERMKNALETLVGISDEVFRPQELDTDIEWIKEKIDPKVQEDLRLLMDRLYPLLANYAVFVTPSGFVGFTRYHDLPDHIASETRRNFRPAAKGDLIVHFYGGGFPFILRQTLDSRTFGEKLFRLSTGHEALPKIRYTIVDGCCLPAIMDAQLLRRAKDGLLQECRFTLE